VPQVRIPSHYPVVMGQKWKECRMCGGVTQWVTLTFDSGSGEPTEDETLTGATSAATGVVEEVILLTGSWAGGDAAGYVELSSPTGIDAETMQAFSDNELINGSTAGDNCMTADGDGNVKNTGILHPKGNMVFKNGGWYCKWHYAMKYGDERLDEYRPDLSENNRGQE